MHRTDTTTGKCSTPRVYKHGNFLLFKVPSFLFADQNELRVKPCAELFVDISERWRRFEVAYKPSDGDRFA